MKQITDLTKCPFCASKNISWHDNDSNSDNHVVYDTWYCNKCLHYWKVEYKAVRVFYTASDPDGVRDEIDLGTVVDPQEG